MQPLKLEKIVLKGFKSFADKTEIPIESCLFSVVGPNGCGKSNIADAIRWVLGERSSKAFRSDSSDDVIFNGSAKRSPASGAYVALHFKNNGIQGAWSHVAQIVISRRQARLASSIYEINGQACRRLDIIQLLSGTGLSSKGYTVIEQGAISELVLSAPSEIRQLINQAANLDYNQSKKKETQNRIERVKTDMIRLDDLIQERRGQMERLARAAALATQFRADQSEKKQLEYQLIDRQLKVMGADHHEKEKSQASNHVQWLEAQSALEQSRSKMMEIETDQKREALTAQTLYRKRDSLKESIHLLQVKQLSIQKETNHQKAIIESLEQEETALLLDCDKGQKENSNHENQWIQTNQAAEALKGNIQQIQVSHDKMQSDWLASQALMNEQDAQIKHLRQHIAHKEEMLALKQKQKKSDEDRLKSQSHAFESLENSKTFLDQKTALSEVEIQHHVREKKLTEEENILIQALQTLELSQATVRANQADLQAKHAAMQAHLDLNRAWRNQTQAKHTDWVTEHQPLQIQGLSSSKHQAALDYLFAMPWFWLEDQNLSQWLNCPTQGVAAYIHSPRSKSLPTSLPEGFRTLASCVQANAPLPHWATRVYLLDDSALWLEHRELLEDDAWVCLPDGRVAGRDCIISVQDSEAFSWLNVYDESVQIEKTLNFYEGLMVFLVREATRLSKRQTMLRIQLTEAQAERLNQMRSFEQLRASQSALEIKSEQANRRRNELTEVLLVLKTEQMVLNKQIEEDNQALLLTRDEHEKALIEKKTISEASYAVKEAAMSQKEKLQEALNAWNKHEKILEALKQTQQNEQARLIEKQARLEALAQKRKSLEEKENTPSESIDDCQKSLNRTEAELSETEEALASLRKNQKTNESTLQTQAVLMERLRTESERFQMTQVRLDEQIKSLLTTEQMLKIQLAALGDVAMPNEAPALDMTQAPKRIALLEERLQKMRHVNLGAEAEYQAAELQWTELTQKRQEILDALALLEQAIDEIDSLTRTGFLTAFNTLNDNFQLLFRNVFQSEASLEMEDSDPLTAGVVIKAQMAGKAQLPLQLMSGGERAMIALIFILAIVKMNPLPFCVLDEVDAPLDDKNAARLINLLKTLSDEVSFIIITHNKQVMQFMDRLIGVTMEERGVSHIVSVQMLETLKKEGN